MKNAPRTRCVPAGVGVAEVKSPRFSPRPRFYSPLQNLLSRWPAICAAVAAIVCLSVPAQARVPYPVNATYEDTVRVVIIWNTTGMAGVCPGLPEAGQEALNFVIASLDTAYVPNVRTFNSEAVTLADVQNAFGGPLPHVIVHINGGWGMPGAGTVTQVFNWAVANYVGVVEIGDDAAYITQSVFTWSYTGNIGSNLPSPMYAATWLQRTGDSLWIELVPSRDTLIDSLKYPGLNGIVRNTAYGILHDNTLVFKPFPSGRCESDPDSFLVPAGSENLITFLGYQQGWNATLESGSGGYPNDPANDGAAAQGLVGQPDQFINVAAFQDERLYTGRMVVRRAVALSFQPQYLRETVAAQQLVYDAIMYSSLAHTLVPVAVQIAVSADTITAGSFSTLTGQIVNEELDTITKQRLAQTITWRLVPGYSRTGDSLTGAAGASTQITGTQAFRTVRVEASFYDSAFQATVTATATIYVKPGPDYKVTVERTSTTPLAAQTDVLPRTAVDSVRTPVPGDLRYVDSIRILSNQSTAYAYAVVRDAYGNIKRAAINASWSFLPPAGVLTVVGTDGKFWEGVVTRQGSGTDSIVVYEAGLIGDTVRVVVEPAPAVQVTGAITGDMDGDGYLDRITISLDSTIVLPASIASTGFQIIYQGQTWQVDTVRTRNGTTTDSVVFIDLVEVTGGDLQTSWKPTVTLPALGLAPPTSDYPTTDGAGPVIERAKLFPLTLGGGVDTLRIYFSEPVQWPSGASDPANLYAYFDTTGSPSGNLAAFQGIVAASTTVWADSAVVLMTNRFVIRPGRDSVQLRNTYLVTDAAGNQALANGHKAPIEWGGKSDLKVVALNNPFEVGGSTPLPPAVQAFYGTVLTNSTGGATNTPGVLTAVQSVKPLEPETPGSSSYGKAIIYDAVGNVVKSDLHLYQANPRENRNYAVFWDGKNRNGRFVGGGTYLMIVTARDIDGKKINQRIKVGVKIKG